MKKARMARLATLDALEYTLKAVCGFLGSARRLIGGAYEDLVERLEQRGRYDTSGHR